MDRKEDEENPPGSSHRTQKRKRKISSPSLERKRIASTPNVKAHKIQPEDHPAEDVHRITQSACGSDARSQIVFTGGESDSTDSDRDMDQPSLLEQLKTILDSYQDAQIIRELIQNADDAKASKMKIIYVKDDKENNTGQHKQNGCYSEYFRSPALCVYNDAVFNEQDWTYMRSISRSGKSEDALKVGRFGLGFKSVFHITDNPVIISDDKLLVIDPFRSKKKLGKDCHTLKFKKLRKSAQKKRHYSQALAALEAVYGHCGFTEESLSDGYKGTLFWFPFRRTPSELSTKVFGHRDVKDLITMFKKEAHCFLLFLKNITDVSLYEKDTKSSFSVECISSDTEEKASFNKKLAKLTACKGQLPNEDMKAIFPVKVTVKDSHNVTTQQCIVCSYIKGKKYFSEKLRELAEDKQLSYSPFVGIAVPVNDTSGTVFRGHVFCFLPLPSTGENYTGLPVHINGFFALSQDRHHVKWPEDDQFYREDRAQMWNRLLCEEVIVDAYIFTLDYMKGLTVSERRMESDNLIYKALPSKASVRPNWDTIVDPLYTNLKEKDIFYTKNNGGKWIKARDAIFSTLDWNEDSLVTIRQTEQCIINLLLDCKRNVVNVPSYVAEFFPFVPRITPKYLRDAMRENPIYTNRSAEDKFLLLQFVLADQQYSDLADLELLPLEDESFGVFDGEDSRYLCTRDEMKMFPGIEQKFVRLNVSHTIRDHLTEIQKTAYSHDTAITTCLRKLNSDDFPKLLEDTLSANGEVRDDGTLYITTCDITMEWLDHVWNFIGQQHDTLKKIEHMSLVPVKLDSTQILEMMALKGRYVVAKCRGMRALDLHLKNALSNLKLTVIKHIPQGETYDRLMEKYCKYPNLEDVMQLLDGFYNDCKRTKLSNNAAIRYFNERSSLEEKQALLNFLSKDCQKTRQRVDDLLKYLDIFPETSDENKGMNYTSILKNDSIACRNSIPVKYPVTLLHLESSQRILAKRLGAKEMSEEELAEEIMRVMVDDSCRYSRSSKEKFMRYILKNLNKLAFDKSRIFDLGSRIKFIKISSADEVAMIGQFFDHTDRNLQELFYFEDRKFLPSNWRDEDLEPALKKFGLKREKDVKAGDVTHVVEILDCECRKQNPTDETKIKKCSLQVMKLLEKMATQSSVNLDSLNLSEYRWIAFCKNRPPHYPKILPWYGDQFDAILCSPEDVFSTKHESLCASVRCTVETHPYPGLADSFGWHTPPDVNICLLQLKAVRNKFSLKHKATLLCFIREIYQQMSGSIKSKDEGIASKAVVCTGERFYRPEKVFISFPTQENNCLEPYMYKLPGEFSDFSSMFVLLGSTSEFTIRSLKSILTTIKTTTRKSTQESDRDRKIVINILKSIVRLKDGGEDDILSDVLVPVVSNNATLDLRPVEECTFSDTGSSWLHDHEGENEIHYVHSDVNLSLAKSLGIQSFTQRFMSEGGTEEIFSACGQSEPLTTRLKHILENYPDGLAVLKELVQNADDAGAQCIHFLYDERQNINARTGLFDANMAKCQGPALWAFNDAEFTETDFQNIIKLGGETKKGTKVKIGKFGLGFCAVYNLTDVPSFLSGHSLVIFDPHTTHLGKAIQDKSSPGIRLSFTEKSSGILKLMRNQFRPYNNIFGCDLSGDTFPPKFEGTLFRLPLRTTQQAEKSEIKKTPYRRQDMVALFHLLKGCAGDLLTFTQNIKEIKVLHLPEKNVNLTMDLQLVFSIDKAVIKTNPTVNSPAGIHVMREVEKAFRANQNFMYNQLISIKMFMAKSILLGVKKSRTKSSPWLVSWASGSGKPLRENAVRLESEGALPLGSIAISLKEANSKFTVVPFPFQEKQLGFYATSHYFCFLPLPEECKTPVHINGCFAVGSDRKGLAKKTSDEKGETRNQVWNQMLMSDAVCNAYISMLTSLDQFGIALESYSLLWPIIRSETSVASYLSKAFCENVIKMDCKVFCTTQGCRASFHESVFLDNDLRHDKMVGNLVFDIFHNFFRGENIPMDMSKPIYEQFCRAGCKEELCKQTLSAYTFFEEIFFPNINEIDGKKRDALVMFILKTNQHNLRQLMKSTPCIPVLCKRQLRSPSELVRPKSVISNLFLDEDGRFPSDANQTFCKDDILDVLVKLGMMDQTLPDEIIVERATSIANISDPKKALLRCRKLLAYLDREQQNCQGVIKVLSSTPFIPSLKKPLDWPLPWVASSSTKKEVRFSPPNQMFLPTLMEQIACSQLIVDVQELKKEFKVKKILQFLGVRANVLYGDVEKQLMKISRVICDHLSNEQKSRLHSICLSVYSFFDSSTETLTGRYDELPIIWMSDRLISPKHATLETFHGIDCRPAIYQLEKSDVSKYTHFLKCVGVQETLSKENIISALEQIAIGNEKKSQREESVRITVNLLQLLATVCKRPGSKLNAPEKSRIYVPDDANVLRLAEELCVDDGYRLQKQSYMHFVNTKVSGDIVKLLDIKSKRVKHINNIKGSLPFGQKEELVTRLKGILESYPRDETILYELLQNADDAGAKEIMFIRDMRQHETKTGIFGKEWSAIQGPALCVFNDSCFSVKDLEGICKLGEGSKFEDPSKTGQFGVGFNAVYHLTDAPSFITKGPTTPNQGTFCVFDPHCKFCQATDDDPGLQFPDLEELEETYPGVFECYLQEELASTKGTWFRFPLRNKSMARSSLICDKPIDIDELSSLLELFKKNMKKCLLFLRNIRKISLSEIDIHGNIKLNHTVESNLKEKDEGYLGMFCQKCDTLTKAMYRSRNLEDTERQTVKYVMTTLENSLQPEHWIIAQTFGFDNTNVSANIIAAFQNRDIALTPKGAVALPCIPQKMEVCTQTECEGYTLSSLGEPIKSYGESKEDGQVFCFLPLPLETGLPVHVNGHFAVSQTRRSMWDTTHRGEWNKLLFETVISNSYIIAIEYLRDALLPENDGEDSVTLMDIKSKLERYHDAFPRYDKGKTDLIKGMITSFFTALYERGSKVFPVISPNATPIWWVALQQSGHTFPACFNNLCDQFRLSVQPDKMRQYSWYESQKQFEQEERNLKRAVTEANALSSTLKDVGMKLLESPLWIHHSMKEALQVRLNDALQAEKQLVNPSLVIEFLKTGNTSPDACLLKDVMCEVTTTSVKSTDNVKCLLRYCLQDLKKLVQEMEQIPLLVTNDGILRFFSSTKPVILSSFCDLLPKSARQFVHSDIVNVLQNIPIESRQCLKCLELDIFAEMLPANFDRATLSGPEPITWNKEMLGEKWVHRLWQFLDTLKDINIQALENWHLLPGELKTHRATPIDVLVPCDQGFILLDKFSFENEPLRQVLASLNIPTLHLGNRSTTLKSLVASQQEPVRFVQCLHYHKDNLKYLKTEQCKQILHHLSKPESIVKLGTRPSIADKIRDLPLFTTVNGNNVSLSLHNQIFTVKEHDVLIKDGMESWSGKCRYTLLKENRCTVDLMEFLSCPRTISVTELYCKHILPYFGYLEQNHHLLHLEYVRSMLRNDPDCPLRQALRTSRFIYQEGTMKSADCFYSPHNRLCKRLCDKSMLPPDPFGFEEWETLMVYAGMRQTVSEDLFVQFAKQIEHTAQTYGMTGIIKEQSKEIVTYLFATEELCNNAALLERIKNIRFVEPYRVKSVYERIHPQFGLEGLIQLCGSVYHSQAQLVWTSTCILPSYVSRNDRIRNGLGILQNPSLRDVLSHTHNVCDSINKGLQKKKTTDKFTFSGQNIKKLMTLIYAHLQEYCMDHPDTKRMLSETPILHIREEEIFVTARQVSVSFDGNKPIPPYLVKFPLYYGPYEQLFQFLGITESVSLSQYADVLSRIHEKVKTKVLDPYHIKDVETALRSMMLLLEEKCAEDIETSMADIETLYLPTSDKCLAKSSHMVFVDRQKLKSRVMKSGDHGLLFVHSLRDCHKEEDTILKLPDSLKPKKLSSILQENLISSSISKQDTKGEQLEAFLSSSRFLKAMKIVGKFSDKEFDSYRQRLVRIQFVPVSEIRTILTMDGRQISDTEADRECFHSGENDTHLFYFVANNSDVRSWLRDIGQELFRMFSDCLDNKIEPEKLRLLVEFIDDPERFSKYCEDLFGEEESKDIDSLSYFPGKLVPLGLHELLQNEMTLLKVGDLVAYEKSDPLIEGNEEDSTSGMIYIFARIIKIISLESSHGIVHQKYEVNFGKNNNEIVLGLRLYKVVYPESPSSTELVVHQFGHDRYTPLNRDNIFDEIIATLSEAWKLDDANRKRVLKRLLLIWHPDKNHSKGELYQKFSTDVTQFIYDIVRRLDKGETFDIPLFNPTDGGKRMHKRKRHYDEWNYGERSNKWHAFGERISSLHRDNRYHFNRSYSRSGTYVPNPQPAEARRWLRQASMDYRCGVTSLERNKTTPGGDASSQEDYNWICYKFHQACEKACKAYVYYIDEKKVSHSHDLGTIIPQQAGNEQLVVWLRDIESIVGSYFKMRYPDVMDYPNIPGTSYTIDQANRLMELTAKVMEEIENKL